jgi:transcriptional regulator with GAF, ATPase, and Fis domain
MSNRAETTIRKGREQAPGQPVMRALLHLLYTPRSPAPLDATPLFEGDDVAIGRNVSPPDVLLDDPHASRLHARVTWDAGRSGFRLDDPGSANGTFVNGLRERTVTLRDQDVLRIGDSLLCYDERRVSDRVRERASQIATANLPALLVGETGTGKEVMARFIHDRSGRRGAFVPVNCGALPRELAAAELFGHTRGAFSGAGTARAGLFLSAAGGTLFLDEIGDLPLDLQPALLRVLQERAVRPVGADREVPVDVRVVAATNVDLQAAIAGNRFRADLYARLAQAILPLAPLRERRFEIPGLLRTFAAAEGRPLLLTPDALEALLLGSYPYNVRELKALLAEFFVVAKPTAPLDLPYLEGARPALATVVGQRTQVASGVRGEQATAERERLVKLLESHGGNVSAVAKQLGKPRAQIYRWLTRLGLSARQHRR